MIRFICIAMLLGSSACGHFSWTATAVPPPSARDRALAARTTQDLNAAYPLYAEALCEALAQDTAAGDAAELLRTSLEIWEALGRPHMPPQTLTRCPLPAPLQTLGDALVASAMANWQRAADLLAQAAAQASASPGPWRAEVAMRQALVAMHTGQSRAVDTHLRTATAATPQVPEVHLFAAHTRLHLQDPRGAVDALRPLLHLAPTAVDLGRARLLVQQAVDAAAPPPSPADLAAAEELMQTLQADPIDPEELAHARLLVSAAPHPRVFTLAGLLALRLGATAQGMDWLEHAQAQNPLDAAAPRIVAGHYVAQRDTPGAIMALHAAWHANPFDAELAAELARQEKKSGDLQGAAKTLATLQVLEPQVPEHAQAYAEVQAQLKDRAAPQSNPPAPPASR